MASKSLGMPLAADCLSGVFGGLLPIAETDKENNNPSNNVQ
jgi:hypothetical protein